MLPIVHLIIASFELVMVFIELHLTIFTLFVIIKSKLSLNSLAVCTSLLLYVKLLNKCALCSVN